MSRGNAGQNIIESCVPAIEGDLMEGDLQMCTPLERYAGDQRLATHRVVGTYRETLKLVPSHGPTS